MGRTTEQYTLKFSPYIGTCCESGEKIEYLPYLVSLRSVESTSLSFLMELTKGIMGLTFDNWIWHCLKELKSSCLRCSALASNI